MPMNTILGRYISKTMLLATALITLIMAGVLFIMTLISELKNIGEGDYGFFQAFLYILMRLPTEVYQFSPMLILLGGIAGLSILSTHRELTVMRASGFSTQRVITSIFAAALAIAFIFALVGETIAPKLTSIAEMNKDNEKNADQLVVTSSGVWLHVDNNFIHIERVVGKHLLEGVTRYEFDAKHHLQAAYYAKTLSYQYGRWTMHDVVMTSFYPDRTLSRELAQSDWTVRWNTNLLNIGVVEPNQMALPKLVKTARYLEKNGLRSSEYRFEFWQRILQPVASLIMIFLAIPFVLGTLSSVTLGRRMVVGVLVGFAFFILNSLLGQISIVYQVPAMLAASMPLIAFAVLGVFLSKRLIRR